MSFRNAAILAALLAFSAAPHGAHAVASATFVFDTTTDPGDLADGPDFDATGVDPIDDTGLNCDTVVMVMVDATGTPVDVDSFCISTLTGTGGSDGDYGSFGTGYLPVLGPATYALFDLTADDMAALSGFGDSDQEYFDYVVANCRLLSEQAFDIPPPISNAGPAFSFEGGMQCYQVKDRTVPKLPGVSDVPVSDAFAEGTVDVKKLAYYCAPLGGDAFGPGICCYKAKGSKLSPAPILETLDDFGAREISVGAPKLLCQVCRRNAVPVP